MIRTKFIKQRVTKLHRAVGAVRPPLNIALVAQHCGLSIERVARLDRGVRAQYLADSARIEVLDSLAPTAERFAVAHEIGHADLGHGEQSCYLDYIAEAAGFDEIDMGPEYEPEASAFANHLLVPREWLKRAVDAELGVAKLRELFKVSREVLFIALDREKFTKRVAGP